MRIPISGRFDCSLPQLALYVASCVLTCSLQLGFWPRGLIVGLLAIPAVALANWLLYFVCFGFWQWLAERRSP